MKRLPIFSLIVILAFLFSATGPALPGVASAASTQTYTVLVGAEDLSRHSDVMAFFPETLHIHVGDTVLWKQNTHEIHTVTFLANTPEPALILPAPASFPPGSLMLNPQVAFPTAPLNGM